MTAITYLCINCHSTITAKPFQPVTAQERLPRLHCPFCLHMCAPEQWLENNYDQTGMFDWQAYYKDWSHCPNAYQCSLYDQYAPDCEEGRLMQKCLVSIHREAEPAPVYNQAAAQRTPKRQPGKKPDNVPPGTQ